ncbi:MAG: EAL domain-containing protein [Pseudohongiella sp.]|nr:EAL domain-containing protein [Pseudohongiella sp.]MDO9519601.1 EAL domain-containing protein [Pseudohongiella sp.]MDP2127704.1 EAL domain-containing protein [Pseudohongiella sp.]
MKPGTDKTNKDPETESNSQSGLLPVFDAADPLQIEKLYRAGEYIMRQGDVGDSAYFIQSGRVLISLTRPDGSELLMGQRGAGSLIGEMAIVDDGPRSATVKAIEDCRLLEISKADFTRALRNSNPIVGLVTRLILLRYRDVLQRSENIKDFSAATSMLEQLEKVHAEESRVLELVRMANEFRVAVARNQLFLEYQPFVNMESGKVLGFEALMRWQHPVKGKMRPDLFIPMAEDTGLIIDATRWAFRESCSTLKRLQQACGDTSLFMSINFSALDFDDPAFPDEMMFILHEIGVSASNVHLEITERLLLRHSDQVRRVLLRCRELGMHISIDDFGTGYSSLSYLHQYPVSILKIDQSFVRNMIGDDSSLSLVKTIISLSQNMGFEIIAEGVETIEQARLLLGLRCHVAQGYYYARPMPEEAALMLLEKRHG